MELEVIVDMAYAHVTLTHELEPTHNKFIVGIANDFEDGEWRHEKFHSFIWDNISETALSFQERDSLVGQPLSTLQRSAKNLRLTDHGTSIGEASEIAEIALYAVMKHHYGALPVVPKIFYKQNVNDNAKGADSAHIVIESEDTFTLWFGESKFYNSIEDARLYSIVNSVAASLQTDKLKKENSIITNVSDIEHLSISPSLKAEIIASLSQGISTDEIRPMVHIPILILYECEITKGNTTFSDEYKQKIIEHQIERADSYFKKQLKKLGGSHMYDKITFHIVLVPVPDKDSVVDRFVSQASTFRG